MALSSPRTPFLDGSGPDQADTHTVLQHDRALTVFSCKLCAVGAQWCK